MNTTYTTLTARLDEQRIQYRTLVLADTSLIVVSSLGGRVYGPFRDAEEPSQTWVPKEFSDPKAFAELVSSGFWNLGGERIWIGPEITYIIEDRNDYWGTFVLPPCLDPAPHEVIDGEQIELVRKGTLTARHTGSGEVNFDMRIKVSTVPSPFRFVGASYEGLRALKFGGYRVQVDLNRDGHSTAPMESWDIVQVLSGGTAIIPATPDAEVTDYYEPVGSLLERRPGVVTAALTGKDKYKIGVKAAHVYGRSGYLRQLNDGQVALLVREFENDPAAPYGEEPDFAPGVMGDSIHLYNDDGELGGFAELESRGYPTGTDTGLRNASNRFTSWWFYGDKETIDLASRQLLGVGVDILGEE